MSAFGCGAAYPRGECQGQWSPDWHHQPRQKVALNSQQGGWGASREQPCPQGPPAKGLIPPQATDTEYTLGKILWGREDQNAASPSLRVCKQFKQQSLVLHQSPSNILSLNKTMRWDITILLGGLWRCRKLPCLDAYTP